MHDLAKELAGRLDRLEVVIAATRKWDPLLHPRGRDGKFIEKGGWIKGLLSLLDKAGNAIKTDKEERAEVLGIRANPADPDNPILDVRTSDGRTGTVIAGDVDVAPSPKAYLSVVDRTRETGGSTTFIGTDHDGDVTSGKVVSPFPERSHTIESFSTVDDAEAVEAVRAFQEANADLLGQDEFALGSWVDQDTDTLWLDVVAVVETPEAAEALAVEHNQIAYFDLDTGQEVRTGGTGEAETEIPGQEAGPGDLGQQDLPGEDRGGTTEEVPSQRDALAAELRERVHALEAEQNRIGWNMGAPGAAEALAKRQEELRNRVHAAQSELDAVEKGFPISSSGKVLDAKATDYGLKFDGSFEHDDTRVAALGWENWDDIPVQSVDPKSLIAVEEFLSKKSIDKVVGGGEPLRKGYTVRVAERSDGRRIIVDGHHRAAMAAAMGQPLEVQIMPADYFSLFPTDAGPGFAHKISQTQLAPGDAIPVTDLDEAVRLLADGQKILLTQPDQVSTLLDKMQAMVEEAKAAGGEAPNFDLCNVTAVGTNLFCVESKGIPRIEMPQLSGQPLPGSKADKMPDKNRWGGVDLTDAFRNMLAERGHTFTDEVVMASHLKASQNELNGLKVAGIAKAMERGEVPRERIFISSDGYVVDGHHRWAAAVANSFSDPPGEVDMDVTRVDMNIVDLLALANDFSLRMGIPQASAVNPGSRVAPAPLSLENENHPLADRVREIVATAVSIEPEVTDGLIEIAESQGGMMTGLDFRFKASDGILDKTNRKVVAKGITPEEAIETIDDALRYTMVLPADGHAPKVRAVIDDMNARGFTIANEDIQNGWERGDAYNGINLIFTHAGSGMRIEAQFHTADSFWTKQYGTHADYEISRNPDVPWPERKAAFDRMVALADEIEFPDSSILELGVLKARPFDTPNPAEVAPTAPAAV